MQTPRVEWWLYVEVPKEPLLKGQEVLTLVLRLDEAFGLERWQSARSTVVYDPSVLSSPYQCYGSTVSIQLCF